MVAKQVRTGLLAALLSLAISPPATAQENAALVAQRANALPLTPFYDVNGSDLSRPGTLIRSEEGTGYSLPGGVTAKRIAYASRDVAGKPVLTTGVVLLPPGTPPAGGWPVIAWAHGTAGVARVCAPSLMKDIYYGWKGVFIYPLLGYAVVATDYAGLGGPGPHQYMWSRAQANDVLYSIPAARAAVPSLGPKWVAIGHSQGGYAVLRISAMRENAAKAGFLGSIPISSGADIAEVWRSGDGRGKTVSSTIPMMALSIKSVYPDFDMRKMIGSGAMAKVAKVQNEDCLSAADKTMRDVPLAEGRVPGWMDVPEVAGFAKANRIFTDPIRGPVLLILSKGDQYIPPDLREKIPVDLCKAGDQVAYRSLNSVNHSDTIDASLPDQLSWIGDRFAGRPAPHECSTAR
jgi:pimeloyl-ACP methyl ester carboxylesterase